MIKLLLSLFTIASLSLTAQNLNTGLVGYYSFDGNANDGLGNGKHGTVNGAVLTEGINGEANTAYDFSNRSIGILNGVTFPKDYMAVSVWVWMDSITNPKPSRNQVYGGDSFNSGISKWNFNFSEFWESKFHPQCTLKTFLPEEPDCSNIWGYSTDYHTDSINVELEQWHHILFQVDQGVLRFYVNSQKRYETENEHINLGQAFTYDYGKIGADFKGKMDQLRIYNRVLSNNDISALLAEQSVTGSSGKVSKDQFSVFPNPATSVINLPSNIKKYQIYSIVGNKVKEGQNGGAINLTDLVSGNYFIKVTNSVNEVTTTKLVKK